MEDQYNLTRFVEAQDPLFARVCTELAAGCKESHWMWFFFPQLLGLGSSPSARRYAIASVEEARGYLAHPVLGARLRECTRLVNRVEGRTIEEIFGYPDHLKFRSCMTRCAGTSRVRGIPSRASCLLRLAELQNELIRVSANARIEHLRGVRIVLVAQDVARGLELEAGRDDLLLHRLPVDAMQGRGVAKPGSGFRGVVEHDVHTAGLQGLEYRLVDVDGLDVGQVVKVVVVLGRPDEVNAFRERELREALHAHGHVAVVRIGGDRLHRRGGIG